MPALYGTPPLGAKKKFGAGPSMGTFNFAHLNWSCNQGYVLCMFAHILCKSHQNNWLQMDIF